MSARRKWFKGVPKIAEGDVLVVTAVVRVRESSLGIGYFLDLGNEEAIDPESLAAGGFGDVVGGEGAPPQKLTHGVSITVVPKS